MIEELHKQNQELQEQYENQIEAIKGGIAEQIQEKENELLYQLGDGDGRLQSKEEEFAKLKPLFVEKLRDIENSF